VCCGWSEAEKPWPNYMLHLPTWTDEQWGELFQEPSRPELESQVIAKFLQHGIIRSARLLIIKKNSPPQSLYNPTGKLEAWASPFCPNPQPSNPNKSREMGGL